MSLEREFFEAEGRNQVDEHDDKVIPSLGEERESQMKNKKTVDFDGLHRIIVPLVTQSASPEKTRPGNHNRRENPGRRAVLERGTTTPRRVVTANIVE
jgi:hypothetical protein